MSKMENTVSFRALQLANEHRNSYGLRYNDFTRYRKHCGNRTHRLRSTLKMTHGKGRDFKNLPPITLENIKSGHLELLLFETERAWAYAQDLYNASLQPAKKDVATKLRHKATGRFRRAIHWCTQLLSHCQNLYNAQRFKAENMLEIDAYTLILSGRFLRFRDEFEDALDQLCVARDILDQLAEYAQSSRDQALATFFSDEIAPEIRFCAHQLGQENSYDIDRIVKEIAPKNRDRLVDGYAGLIDRLKTEGRGGSTAQGRKRLQELFWEGEPVPIRNPELVDVLLRVQDAEAFLKAKDRTDETEESKIQTKDQGEKKHHRTRKGVAAFDAILAALSDAEEVARKLAEAQKATSGSVRSGAGSRDIHFVHDYVVYNLLSRRVERDLTLVSALIASSQDPRKHTDYNSSESKNKKPRGSSDKNQNHSQSGNRNRIDARVNPAIVKLLDTVVQSLEHMRSLSIVEESIDLASAVEARLAFTKSRRCVYLARSYAAVKQYAQALTLTQRSHLYVREASSLVSTQRSPSNTATPSFYPLTLESTTELEQLLEDDEERFKRDWFAYNGGSIKPERDTSKKPLFFDIALNYVQLDIDKLQERAGIATKEKVPVQEARPIATPVAKAKMEEIERPATPESSATSRGGGLGSLLGGWWGRK